MTTDEQLAIDIELTVKVMEWPVFTYAESRHDGNTPRPHCVLIPTPDGDRLHLFDAGGKARWWSPSREIGDAWLVVENLLARGLRFELRRTGAGWWAYFGEGMTAEADTAPEAICRAALKATVQPR